MKSKSDIIAYIRGLPEDDVLLDEVQSLIDGYSPPYVPGSSKPKMAKPKELQFRDGAINPAFLVELRDIAIDYNAAWQNYFGRQWPKFSEQIKQIETMAKQAGIDLASYAPELLTLTDIATVDDILCATEAQLRQLAERIETSHERGLELLSDAKKKRWVQVLRKTWRLQEMCRTPVPMRIQKRTKEVQETWRYLHPLRYALYCLRSHLTSTDGEPLIIETPHHLIMTCLVMECAEQNSEQYQIDGVLIVIPPRHGKTTLMQAKIALGICKDGHHCNAILHHNGEHANDRVGAVKEHFDLGFDVGRRRNALYPHITMDGPRSKNKRELSVFHNGKRLNLEKEGNLKAYGVHSQSQGVTIHKLNADDPSDQKEQSEEGTRQRTNAALAQTWIPRLTGRKKFLIYICTRWHPQDFTGVLLNLARKGDMNLAYFSMACGGPEDNFAPIWPEAGYDENYLRGAFGRLGAIMYACQYQNNPDAKESRRIKTLECFDAKELDPDTRSPEYQKFFSDPATVHYISVDPTGTSSKRSHKAGITYAAFGNLQSGDTYLPKCLFLRFWSLHEGQLGLAKIIADFVLADKNKVDTILVETTSGFHATPEALEVVYGIDASKVLRRPPGTGTKVERLLRYAINLEAGDVQFPGIWVTGERGEAVLQMDPDWAELSGQLLQASSADDDHLLDCVRQQLAEIAPDIYTRKYHGRELKSDKPKSQKEQFYGDLMSHLAAKKRRAHLSPGRANQGFFQGASIA